MTRLDDRTMANMDFVPEETCRVFPNGEAQRGEGKHHLGGLRTVAHGARKEITQQRSA